MNPIIPEEKDLQGIINIFGKGSPDACIALGRNDFRTQLLKNLKERGDKIIERVLIETEPIFEGRFCPDRLKDIMALNEKQKIQFIQQLAQAIIEALIGGEVKS